MKAIMTFNYEVKQAKSTIMLRATMTLLMVVMTCASAWASDAIVTGFTATSGTAGTGEDENENYAKLVDGDRSTKWCITKFSSCYIEFEADEAFIPTAYILTTGNDNASRHGRNPKKWTLKAKTNKHDWWVTIASVSGDDVLQDVNTTDFEFSIAHSGIYRYFRLEVSEVKSGDVFQLGELQFRGHSPSGSELAGVTLDETIQYITDVKLIGGSQSEVNSLVYDYTHDGWLVNEQNLNAGAGGDVIYLLYKMGSVATANQSFITDIYLSNASYLDLPGSFYDDGDRHYTLASYDGSNDFKKYKGNLNNGVKGSDQIHLYYSTDNYTNRTAISSIIFNRVAESNAVGINGSNIGYNLNNGAVGDKIYMHCPRNYAPQWIIQKSSDGGRCIIKGFEGGSGGINKSDIKAIPSILGGAQVEDYTINLNQFSNLKTIYFIENLKTPEMIPMDGCTNLQHVHTVDNSGKVIKPDELPSCITNIPNEGFYGCSALTRIIIPASVTNIGQGAFKGCGLTAFTVDENNPNYKSIGGVLMDKAGKTLIAYPCGSTSEKYTIPNSVTSIGQSAFLWCLGLTSITIPGSVTSIGQGAFYACNKLASVSIMGNPKMGSDAIPDEATVTLSLTANDANGAKWMTFYNDRYNFQADESTTVYKATVSGQSLVLTEVADKIVNSATRGDYDIITAPGTAVILRSSSDPVMTRVSGRSSDTQANALLGTMEETVTPANTYTLASGSKGVGFYRYTGSKVAAGKAYLVHNGASAAREFIGFDGETTGIVAIDHSPLTIDHSPLTIHHSPFTIDHSPFTIDHSAGAWYSIDGRKLQGGPSKKGIYVRNGIKVVIK